MNVDLAWGRRWQPSDAIYPEGFPFKPDSGIQSWNGWPDDVRDLLLRFNRRGFGPWQLSFYGAPAVFKCDGCAAFCHPQRYGTATVHHRRHGVVSRFCDECLITAARNALAQQDS